MSARRFSIEPPQGKGSMRMNADDRLSIHVTHLDGVAVLALRGEIDGFTAPRLRESVAQVVELGVPVVLDMELVTFMDSAGISALIAASGLTNGVPKSVHITRPSNHVLRVLSLVGLDRVFLANDEERPATPPSPGR